MGKWKWRKPEPANVRGLCCQCGKNPQKNKGHGKYKPLCCVCDRKVNGLPGLRRARVRNADKRKRPYRRFVGALCERCEFKPEHVCQLDVDHIDGVHSNNAPDNLQTLCANCHRLKTYQERNEAA